MKNKITSLDDTDYKIIKKLMEQARTTWAELGSLLGLSSPGAAERVRRLEEKGVIKGYSALVEPELVDCGVTAFITVYLASPLDRSLFLGKVQSTAAIQECHHLAGDGDYLLKVRCSSLRELEYIVSQELKGMSGVVKTITTVILSTLKETPVLPLPWEEEEEWK